MSEPKKTTVIDPEKYFQDVKDAMKKDNFIPVVSIGIKLNSEGRISECTVISSDQSLYVASILEFALTGVRNQNAAKKGLN